MTAPPAIYCFSKSGHTRRAAQAFARMTDAELIPVEVRRYKVPALWIARAIWDVGRGHLPPLRTGNVVPAHRPWIAVAGPIWADQMAPPARSVLHALANTDAPIGILTTSGRRAEPMKHVASCVDVLGRSIAAQVNIPNNMDGTREMLARLTAFAEALAPNASSGAA
ncbi:MAG: hypothetical protein AB3N09_04950 [Tateyamaria sp.]